MTRYISYIIALLCLAACGHDMQHYRIVAELDVPEQSYLYFWQERYKKGIAVDSVLVEKGKAVFKGTSDDLTRVEIFTEAGERVMWLYAKNGDRLRLKGSVAASYEIVVEGVPEQETVSRFRNENSALLQELQTDDAAWYARSDDSLFYENYRHNLDTLYRRVVDFVNATPPSYASTILIYDYLLDSRSARIADTMLRRLPPEAKPVSLLAKAELFIAGDDKVTLGKTLPYVIFRTATDSSIVSNSFRRRTTLLTFWASYDTLSRRRLQTVRQLAGKHPRSYLNVVSVSLDTDVAAWQEALRSDSLEAWHQCRLAEGWLSGPVENLGVRRLPATFLLDGAGRVVAKDLPDARLRVAVDSLVAVVGEDTTLNRKKTDLKKNTRKK